MFCVESSRWKPCNVITPTEASVYVLVLLLVGTKTVQNWTRSIEDLVSRGP
jgi:hypothetical protein